MGWLTKIKGILLGEPWITLEPQESELDERYSDLDELDDMDDL